MTLALTILAGLVLAGMFVFSIVMDRKEDK